MRMTRDDYLRHYFSCAYHLRRGRLDRRFYDLLKTYERCPHPAIRAKALAVCAEFQARFDRKAG